MFRIITYAIILPFVKYSFIAVPSKMYIYKNNIALSHAYKDIKFNERVSYYYFWHIYFDVIMVMIYVTIP